MNKRTDITRALKDLDMIELDQRIRLDSKRTTILLNQLEKDTQFLSDCGIIDYRYATTSSTECLVCCWVSTIWTSLCLLVSTLSSPTFLSGRYFLMERGYSIRALVVACSVMMARSCTLWVLLIHSFSMTVFVCRLFSSFNARKFGELAIKTVVMDGKGVSVQKPRICL